ncbi:MAG TPA: winged helix-turn-helix domain-containing protein [Nitrososphaera sp.]|jgi:predicted transcriptional regulator|nr:winged helix-turn-helix domain-containing protein [Nitrososphaera sp.]
MKYRDKIDIISQILEAANGGGASRTRIMYKALLSYAQMKENLMLLTKKDLLRYDEDTRTFKTTEKGLRFLKTYNQIDDMIKSPQQPLS